MLRFARNDEFWTSQIFINTNSYIILQLLVLLNNDKNSSYHRNISSTIFTAIDTFYLTAARSRLFKKLPEIELPKTFDFKKAAAIIKQIKSPRTRSLVIARLDELKSSG